MKKVTLGIIEHGHHFEVLYSQCIILLALKNEVDTILFVDDDTYLQFSEFHENFEWCLASHEGLFTFSEKINKCDLIILDIAEINLKQHVNFDYKPKLVLRIHNINYWLNPSQTSLINLLKCFKQQFKRAGLKDYRMLLNILVPRKLRMEFYYINNLLRQANYLCFCDKTLYEYPKKWKLNYKYLHFPVTYYIGSNRKYNNGKLKVVIPGQISSARRDYEFVNHVLQYISECTAINIQISLLADSSSLESQNIIRKLRKANTKIEIITYDNFIDQSDYVTIMLESHIILNPINLNTWYRGVPEYYSYSKTTGAYGDFLRYGLIPILPIYYKVSKCFESIVERYFNSDDVINILEKYTNNEILCARLEKLGQMLSENNKSNSEQYLSSIKDAVS